MSELVKNTVGRELLEFTDNLASAVKKSQVVFIAVGTPPLASGEPDLSQIITVAKEIGSALDKTYKRIVVNKSTVPVGSGNWVEMLITQGIEAKQPVAVTTAGTGGKLANDNLPSFAVVSNPEFLREGFCNSRFILSRPHRRWQQR